MSQVEIAVVELDGPRLDVGAARILRERMVRAWQKSQAVALDLTKVEYVDSLGLSTLIGELRRKPSGARMVLCGLCDRVMEVFEIAQLPRLFEIFENAQVAQAALAA